MKEHIRHFKRNLTRSSVKKRAGFLLIEVALYLTLTMLLCRITLPLVYRFYADNKKFITFSLKKSQLYNGATLLTRDIMQANNPIIVTDQSLEFSVANGPHAQATLQPVRWVIEKNNIYRIQDAAKNLIIPAVDTIQWKLIHIDNNGVAIDVLLRVGATTLRWIVSCMNKSYDL